MFESIFFARFWGIMLVTYGALFLIRREILDEIFKSMKDKTFVVISGFIALLLGIFSISAHNLWVNDWRVIITLLGWLSFVKGVVRLGFPAYTVMTVQFFRKKSGLLLSILIFMVLIGLFLLWMGLTR